MVLTAMTIIAQKMTVYFSNFIDNVVLYKSVGFINKNSMFHISTISKPKSVNLGKYDDQAISTFLEMIFSQNFCLNSSI